MSQLLDFKVLCQKQAQQLVNLLTLVSVWGVFREINGQQPEVIKVYRSQDFKGDPAIVCYLESAAWLAASLPVFELTLLPFDDLEKFSNRPFIYGFFFPEKDCYFEAGLPGDRYFLFWSNRELNPQERDILECYSQSWVDYFLACQVWEQQRQEYQGLKEAIAKREHQLRNALALIHLYAENLCLGLPSGTWQKQAAVIRETATQLSANLQNLLHYDQSKKLNLVVIDLQKVLQETLELLAPQIAQKQLTIDYPQNAATLLADRWQIKQVFENLLINAIEFSPHGEKIICQWQVFQQEILVKIGDRGSGLSPEDFVKAFIPFYSRRKGGTGLGLTIAKKAILDHKGNIWAENLLEGGAIFSFTLPRHLH
ncbi:MAG: HAMP domain-containing sensor histidine kinase [Jaaginema sp. PMC 1079.18]|nr:HAMP domain-containing sensor histidine kinase [Jaaginema sp. PMC 1080.18]MEC4850676.1 HAMP domain-containing sensor histidine kinase [Jaaginema sp. PMC 1079.18]MEC4866504.1 HAMP domain-containing sensor histidine kinase [Jaaginema sp. PMC 1078.18]